MAPFHIPNRDIWWTVALCGLFPILFSIVAFGQPSAALLALVLVFGVAAGIFNIILAVCGVGGQECCVPDAVAASV